MIFHCKIDCVGDASKIFLIQGACCKVLPCMSIRSTDIFRHIFAREKRTKDALNHSGFFIRKIQVSHLTTWQLYQSGKLIARTI